MTEPADVAGARDLAIHFAQLMVRMQGADVPELALAARLASERTASGHVCADLASVAGSPPFEGAAPAPRLERWMAVLRATAVVGRPGERRPLVLDDRGRLYLHRYWAYERRLAERLLARAGALAADVDDARVRAAVAQLFPAASTTPDWQAIAAITAALRRLCVISGGPGTGKTTTVVRILALLALTCPAPPRVALVAPTGKAAARMQEAVRAAKARLDLPAAARDAIPDDAQTIHRLLGTRAGSARFRHDARQPLAVDVLVVDEASMVDLALMTKLVDALPDGARLILLGDKDQLASVEAGAVLGDVCGDAPGFSAAFRERVERIAGCTLPAASAGGALADTVVLLRRSYRFDAASGIGALAAAVNAGDGDGALVALQDGRWADVGWRAVATPAQLDATALVDRFGPYFDAVRAGADPVALHAAFGRFRVLAALRRGPFGVEGLNAAIEDEAARRGLIDADRVWYAGRPVMVVQNDYGLRLWNGDIGITRIAADGAPRVVFPASDGTMREVAPSRLPAHETVYATTVHKSQGAEFDQVLLVLPVAEVRVVTRELIYTAITRARHRVEVWAAPVPWRAGVEQRTARSSGLRDALWGMLAAD